MERLKYIPKVGDLLIDGTEHFVYVGKRLDKYCFIRAEESKLNSEINKVWYDAEIPTEVQKINKLYDNLARQAQGYSNTIYGIDIGSTVEYNNKQYILCCMVKAVLIADKTITRPLLVNAKAFNTEINDYNINITKNAIVVYESEPNNPLIQIKPPQGATPVINQKILAMLPTAKTDKDSGKVFNLFDMASMEQINNRKLRNGLTKLVNNVIRLGYEENAFGITEKSYDKQVTDTYIDKEDKEREFPRIRAKGTVFQQVLTEDGEIGWLDINSDIVYTEPYFIATFLKGVSYYEFGIQEPKSYIDKEEIDIKQTLQALKKTSKNKKSKKDTNFTDMLDDALEELDFMDGLDDALDEL